MSNHQSDQVTISMPEVITEDSITFYIIIVNIGDVQFKIRHRYSSFETLHSRLVEESFICFIFSVSNPKTTEA